MARLDTSKCTAEQKEKILEYATEFYKQEIDKFWQRSLFFWGFIAAAFIAYAQLLGKNAGDLPLSFLVACFGLVCSIAWTLLNRGSKYWYEAWEQKVRSVELDVLGAPLFSNIESLKRKGIWGAANFSVSQLTIALSDFTALVWLALVLAVTPLPALPSFGWYTLFGGFVTAIYIVLLLTLGRSNRPEE